VVVDIHAHVYLRPRFPFRPDGRTLMSAEEQVAVMDAKGIDASVILPLNNAEAPSEGQSIGEVQTICERYPGRFIPFCNIDPRIAKRADRVTIDDYLPTLEQYRALGFRGFGELVVRLYFDDPRMTGLFAACDRLGFPVTFHTTTWESDAYGVLDEIGLPRLEAVMRALPGLRFFGHSPGFWSEICGDIGAEEKIGYPAGPVRPGGTLQRLLRTYPNLYGDLSGKSGITALTRDPAHAWEFMDEFQDRLLLGLDLGAPTDDMPQLEWLRAARDERHITPEVFDKICGGNAARILELQGPPGS
jgi:predicted TIM-barrel fold metal-dependent hydrolase